MTTGSVNRDMRQTVTLYDPYTPGNVNYRVGTVFSRSWTGEDWPSAKPIRAVPEERSPGLGALSVPPARAYVEEHNYTANIQVQEVHLFRLRSKSAPSIFRHIPGVGHGSDGGFLPWTANEEIQLLGKLRERVAGSDFNAGVFLGEGTKSLGMITQSASAIYNSLRLVKRGRFGDARRLLTGKGTQQRIKKYDDPNWIDSVPFAKRDRALQVYDHDISSGWLELQYGWLPLLKDVYGSAEFLAHQMHHGLQFRVSATLARNWKGTLPSSSSPDYRYAKSTKNLRARVIGKLSEPPDIVGLAGLKDPLSIAWELVPWSFVVDWFIPVGNYLQARGLAQALKGVFIVTLFERITFAGAELVPNNGSNMASQWNLDSSGMDQNTTRKIRVRRIIYNGSLPVPQPEVKPLMSVPSWKRAANAVALLDQLTGRR